MIDQKVCSHIIRHLIWHFFVFCNLFGFIIFFSTRFPRLWNYLLVLESQLKSHLILWIPPDSQNLTWDSESYLRMLRREFSLLTTVMEAISVSSSTNLLLLLLSLLPLLLLLLLLLTTVIADISLLSRPVLDLPNPIRSKNKILYDVSITSLVVEFIPKNISSLLDYSLRFQMNCLSHLVSFYTCIFCPLAIPWMLFSSESHY